MNAVVVGDQTVDALMQVAHRATSQFDDLGPLLRRVIESGAWRDHATPFGRRVTWGPDDFAGFLTSGATGYPIAPERLVALLKAIGDDELAVEVRRLLGGQA